MSESCLQTPYRRLNTDLISRTSRETISEFTLLGRDCRSSRLRAGSSFRSASLTLALVGSRFCNVSNRLSITQPVRRILFSLRPLYPRPSPLTYSPAVNHAASDADPPLAPPLYHRPSQLTYSPAVNHAASEADPPLSPPPYHRPSPLTRRLSITQPVRRILLSLRPLTLAHPNSLTRRPVIDG